MVAALAALADSPSHLRGIAHLRGHETDRLAALATRAQRPRRRRHRDRGRPGHPARSRCTAGCSRTYDDHRLATAGAAARAAASGGPGGERRDDREDAARASPTCGRGCSRAGTPDAGDPPRRRGPRRVGRPGPAEPARHPAPHQGAPPARGRRRRRRCSPSTAAATPARGGFGDAGRAGRDAPSDDRCRCRARWSR